MQDKQIFFSGNGDNGDGSGEPLQGGGGNSKNQLNHSSGGISWLRRNGEGEPFRSSDPGEPFTRIIFLPYCSEPGEPFGRSGDGSGEPLQSPRMAA